MSYVNQAATSGSTDPSQSPTSRDSKCNVEKLLSLAMTNFVQPTVLRLYKVKSPLRSASSVLFLQNSSASAGDRQRGGGGLVVADRTAGKIVEFDASDGRHHRELVSSVDAHDMCQCGTDRLAVVDSNEWGSSVKLVSIDSGQVVKTWGRQMDMWTPSAVATTNDGHLVVSNIHPQASSRLTLFTPDGRQVSHFGRAVGPGDLVFRSPLSVACDVTSGRIFAADADTGCVKVFDAHCSFVTQFGNGSTTSGRNSSAGSENDPAILERPVGVCCDSLGNALVCDAGTQRVVLFSRDGRYLCSLIDFRSVAGAAGKWRSKHRQSSCKLVPVCVGLSSPGSRIAVGLEENGGKSRCFRKLVVCSISPEL